MIVALVLAAGRSRRMGVQKLLLPLDGRPLITRIVDEILRSPVSRTIVVTGPDGDRIEQALAGHDVVRVRNPDEDGEMLGSIRCGVRALPAECSAVLVVPGDSPGIDTGIIAALIAAQDRTGRSLVVPVHAGRRGHPLLVGMRHRAAILGRLEGVGLRGLLRDHPDEVCEVPVESAAVLANLNRPEDLAAWKSAFSTVRPGSMNRNSGPSSVRPR